MQLISATELHHFWICLYLTDDLSETAIECPPDDPSCLGREMAAASASADGAVTATALLPDDGGDARLPPDFIIQYPLSQPETDPSAPPPPISSSTADCTGRIRALDGSIVCPDAAAVLVPGDDATVEAHYDVTSPQAAATPSVGGDTELLMESPSESSSIAVAMEPIDGGSVRQSVDTVSTVTVPAENEYYKYVDEESDAGGSERVAGSDMEGDEEEGVSDYFYDSKDDYGPHTYNNNNNKSAVDRLDDTVDDRNKIWKGGVDDSTVVNDYDDVWKRLTTGNQCNLCMQVTLQSFNFSRRVFAPAEILSMV
jgi:hypothetical protein